MAALVCPKCKAAVVTERPPKRCGQCGRVLLCCRCCAHFEHQQMACLHPEIISDWERVRDPDEPRECPYYRFRPRLLKGPRTIAGISAFTWGTVVIMLVVGALLYIGLSQYNVAVGPGQTTLQLKLESVGTITPDEPFELVFGVYNEGRSPAHNVTLHLGHDLLSFATLSGSDPPCQERLETDNTLSLNFGELGEGGALLGRLTFVPSRAGTHTVKLMASAANCPRPQLAETRLRITP